MLRKMITGLALIMSIWVVLRFTGCSVIGFGIGSAIDSSKPKEKIVPGWEVQTIKPGNKIMLILKDGSGLEGKFLGLDRVPEQEYAEAYSRIRQQKPEGVLLPEIGENITITDTLGKEWAYQFLGYDFRHIVLRPQGETESIRMSLNLMSRIVDNQGNIIEGETIRKLFSENRLPLLSAISIRQEPILNRIPESGIEVPVETTRVALDKIYQIKVPIKKQAALTGFLIGAVVDVTVIIIAVVEASKPEPRQQECDENSCPFVYSFDGKDYVRDSETFGGSIFKSAQRSDWDNLDHLKEINRTYRLKVTNELKESQYIDELKLLVVDHPKGSKLIPSFSGKLHTLSASKQPIKAEDLYGNNVLESVKAKDEKFWLSNPSGRNPEAKSEARDGLILEFTKPEDVSFVKLAFNVQNTPWASFMQGEMLKLQGNELQSWYDLMNHSSEVRQELREAMIREGMLLIKLWDGKTWQTKDFIWEVGPALPKDQIVWLDLRKLKGEKLKLKLESTPGFWIVNSIQADYTPDLPIQITELSPVKAKDYQGKDLKVVLSTIDGNYYVMPSTEDWAELTFIAPPLRKGADRSFVLKSTGYYTINVIAGGEPQKDLIVHLMNEPGAYGQYSLQMFNQHLAKALAQQEEER
jgi:hypothetical protein